MKKIFTICYMVVCMAISSMALAQSSAMSAQFANKRFNSPVPQVMTTDARTSTVIGPVDSYGFLKGPDGATWTYTAAYTYENNHIKGVTIDIYDASNTIVGKLDETFELLETDLWVNNVSISSVVSRKFFNFDNNLEVMLFVYVATKDYQGRYFNNVYSISTTGSSLVCSLDGNLVMAENLSTNPANDNFVMAFYRDGMVKDTVAGTMQYCYSYDIYEKAGYGTNGPKLVRTFDIPYDNIKALNDPMPLLMLPNGGKMNYFVAQYEKPYFVPGTSVYEDPEVTPNNNFIITQYDNKFNVLNTTTIPMVKDPDSRFLYTFYYLGSLGGTDDVILDYNGTGKPAYVVTHDNYEISSDASVNSYYLYDAEGNKINTIVEHSLGLIYLSDVVGQPTQYAFFLNEDEQEIIRFVDVPTCEVVTDLALYNGGAILSNKIDRVAHGDSYQYVVSLLQGEGQPDGSVVQRIAWFNKNGRLDHYDALNLGKNLEYAEVYIYAPVLNPRLFHTDDAYEYMALLKRNQANTTKKEEVLLICNNQGETILELGADPAKGGNLSMIDVMNFESNPSLACIYTDGETYTIHYTPLPLATTKMKGTGTPDDPYQITCVSDFMQIDNDPDACYQIMRHIDFTVAPFVSLKEPFTGKLDGGNYSLKNLCLDGGGLFAVVHDSALIENLFLDHPTMILNDDYASAGFIVNSIRGGVNEVGVEYHALLRNIHLISPTLEAEAFTGTVGGLVGEAALYVEITECSVRDALFTAPNAEKMGGIAGSLSTASFVHEASFEGAIVAGAMVGGIVANIGSGENIDNCHVDADIQGTNIIGGIVGRSGRAVISNCYAEGSIVLSDEATEGEVGGILGHLDVDATKTDETMRVKNCLVGISSITIPASATEAIAHRVAGFTSVNNFEYDWDHVDYTKPQSEWPKIYDSKELCLAENYVISALPVIDATIAAEHGSTEGETIAASEITATWLTEKAYVLGQTAGAPWVFDGNLYLWFENSSPATKIENTSAAAISLVNGYLQAEGMIQVYNLNGMLVAQSLNALSTTALTTGIYVVTVENGAKMKLLVP